MEKSKGIYRKIIQNGRDRKDIFPIGWQRMDEKRIETLGAEFILDEFHIGKYLKKMAFLGGDSMGKDKEETRKKLCEWIEKENNKKLEEWTAQTCEALTEKDRKKFMESWKYIKDFKKNLLLPSDYWCMLIK